MRRRLLAGLAISAVTLGLSALAAELVLRAAGKPFRATWTPMESVLAEFDSRLGWRYVPGRSHLLPFGRPPRMVPIHIDPDGNRAARPDVVADPGRPTVLLVGGSYTFGHGLPFEETFAGRLAGAPDFPYQVVNLGVQAYGTDQALLRLQEVIDRYPVAAVVYTFIEDHVARNANEDRRLLYPDARFLGTKPRFALDGEGGIVLRDRPYRFADRFESSLANWIRLAWSRRGPGPDPELTRALIRTMRGFVESRNATFLLVHWRQDVEFPPGSGERTGGAPSPVLAGLGIEFLDLGAEAPAGWDDWTIPGDPHPDARAHQRAARLIREELRRRGLLDRGAPEPAVPVPGTGDPTDR